MNIFMALLLLSLGAWLFWPARRALRLAARGAGWPDTRGDISRSEMNPDTRARKNEALDFYSVVLSYEYTVMGNTYRGDALDFRHLAGGRDLKLRNEEEARAILAELPAGKTIPVYYNPAKPWQAVLQKKRAGALVWINLSGGVVCIVLGLWSAYLAVADAISLLR